jgi:branched-chain amino acid transport system substrate-binding protein
MSQCIRNSGILVLMVTLAIWLSAGACLGASSDKFGELRASMNRGQMPDMSDFDPNNPVIPSGDTLKIAIVASFSGPAAINGMIDFLCMQWAAHAFNKKGGIVVDGKKKLVEIIKADNMSKPDTTKKVCERMVLQEKVDVLMGTHGSHLMKIINQTAEKHNVLAVNFGANSDKLQDADNFNLNAYMSTFSVTQMGRVLAYYYGQIRKKEKNFYIFCQDYSFGREMGQGFKDGLKEYYPEAQIVGEDYHKLFLTDYAPFLTKITASGAEVIFTGDWPPDSSNMLKQARQMGINLPFANVYMDEPISLAEVGVEGTEGLIHATQYGTLPPAFKTEADIEYISTWHDLWENKWAEPYNLPLFEWPLGTIGHYSEQLFWLLSVIERAESVDPVKVAHIWEGDVYQFGNGKVVKMRACDHKIIQDFHVEEYVRPEKQNDFMNIPPYCWFDTHSGPGVAHLVPAEKVLPWMDPELDRCKGKDAWGN